LSQLVTKLFSFCFHYIYASQIPGIFLRVLGLEPNKGSQRILLKTILKTTLKNDLTQFWFQPSSVPALAGLAPPSISEKHLAQTPQYQSLNTEM
jgi:hypothetical protein